MVHKGPSTGCKRCRERHIKCDEARPTCKRCSVRGLECPGYRGVGGVVFKDVSEEVFAKQKNRTGGPLKARKQAQLIRFVSEVSRKTESPNQIAYGALTTDAGSISVNYFFKQYILSSSRNWCTSRGHFDYLIPLYASASPGSPLALAVEAMAGRAFSLELFEGVNSSWHHRALMDATAAIRAALVDPVASLQDETLLAVLCLDFAEHLRSRTSSREPDHIHQEGALALVSHRGPESFKSDVSRSLLAAIRSNTLLHTLWSTSLDKLDDTALNVGGDDGICNPAIELDKLIAKFLQLAKLLVGTPKSIDDAEQKGFTLIIMAQSINTELIEWPERLPPAWLPNILPRPERLSNASMFEDGQDVEDYESIMVAYVYNQWRCLRLGFLQLLRRIVQKAHFLPNLGLPTIAEIEDEVRELLRGLCSAVPYFTKGCFFVVESTLETCFCHAAPSTNKKPSYRGGAPSARWYLLNILHWVDKIFQQQKAGWKPYQPDDITQTSLRYLSQQRQYIVTSLETNS